MKDLDVEVLSSENAIDNLRHPEKMIDGYDGIDFYPFEDEVIPLREGDIIELNGLELEVMNFFGHTMDSIGLFDYYLSLFFRPSFSSYFIIVGTFLNKSQTRGFSAR